ncbi:surface layer (S-layer) glycoprotein [Bacillus sp. SG-1]|nr:surface layer (S-layer) glycoprotein [Bacillus sp. SG-1]
MSLLIVMNLIVPAYKAEATVSVSYEEGLVKTAEYNANILRKQISYEYNKALSVPNMPLFNQTKDSYTKAYSAVTALKSSTTKTQLLNRLSSNVKLHIDRAVAYIDALNAGKKIETLTKELRYLKNEEIYMLPVTSEYYHKLSSEIRKQAVLLYRVYGKSTRDAILKKYKLPAEEIRNHFAYFVTVYDLMDEGYIELSFDEYDVYYMLDLLISINGLLPEIESRYPEHVFYRIVLLTRGTHGFKLSA